MTRNRSTESARVEGGREGKGKGRTKKLYSPNPSLSPNPNPRPPSPSGIVSILQGGLDSLDLNDFGRPWPAPRRAIIAKLVGEFDYDLCQRAAREAREIVQAQDRAPNITGLFEKKLRDLAEVHQVVQESMGGAT